MYDPVDQRGVPTSRGIPMIVRVAVVAGILATFLIGFGTIMTAGAGHVWPAAKSLRIPMTNDAASR